MVEIEETSSTSPATKDALDVAIERLRTSADHRESDLDIIEDALPEAIAHNGANKGEGTKKETQQLGTRMTKQVLKEICRAHPQVLYETPQLNERLFLHHKGFIEIENLENFTEVKTLYLESNGLQKISGLSSMVHLRKLYLQENLISRIENLDALSNLTSLDLSNNSLRRIENLECLTKLQELQLACNDLRSADDIQHLSQCPSIKELDLENNNLAEPDVLDVVAEMPALRSLRLKGNKMVRKVRHYRKHVLSIMPGLTHFDESPVFESERARVDAWGSALAETPGDFKAAQVAEKVVLKSRAGDKKQKSLEQHNFLGALMPGWTPRVAKTDAEVAADKADSCPGGGCFDSSFQKAQQASTQEKKPMKMSDLLGMGDPRSVANAVKDCQDSCKDLYKQDPLWYNFYLQEPIDRTAYEGPDGPGGGIGPAAPYVSPIGERLSADHTGTVEGSASLRKVLRTAGPDGQKANKPTRRVGVDPPTSLPNKGENGRPKASSKLHSPSLPRDCFDGTFMSRLAESRNAVEQARVHVQAPQATNSTSEGSSSASSQTTDSNTTDMDQLD
jgi:dynein assembly factor 1